MNWADLELLLLLDRHGSLSGAAQEVGVQQSTLTRRLNKLEDSLGQSVFVRTSEGVVPTPLCESLLLPAYRAEIGVIEARRELERQRGEHLSGDVHIATLSSIADFFFAPLLHRFVETYPGIRLHLDPDSRITDLTRLEADIAVRTAQPTGGDLVVKKLLATTVKPHASPALAAKLAETPPEDWPWLTLSAGPQRKMFEARGITPRLFFSSATTMVESMRAGAGVGLLGTVLAGRVGLSLLEAESWAFPSALWLVTHQDLRDAPLVNAVWNWILEMEAETYRDDSGAMTPLVSRGKHSDHGD